MGIVLRCSKVLLIVKVVSRFKKIDIFVRKHRKFAFKLKIKIATG